VGDILSAGFSVPIGPALATTDRNQITQQVKQAVGIVDRIAPSCQLYLIALVGL
jgi:hypothetical protein